MTIDVRDYGAKGDGFTDDTEAIQRAFDAMLAGDTLYFPKGVYRFASPTVLLPPPSTLPEGPPY